MLKPVLRRSSGPLWMGRTKSPERPSPLRCMMAAKPVICFPGFGDQQQNVPRLHFHVQSLKDALEDITVAMTTRTLPLLLWPFQLPLPMTPAFKHTVSSTKSLRPHQARILNRKGCGPLLKPSSVTAGAVAAAVKDATWSASRSPSHGSRPSRARRSRVKRALSGLRRDYLGFRGMLLQGWRMKWTRKCPTGHD